jgi:hypothetical protein
MHGHHPTPGPFPVPRRSHRAAGSSRVQVVVLAAARLRALHLDPLITGSSAQRADQPRPKKNGCPLAPAPVFIERHPTLVSGQAAAVSGLVGVVGKAMVSS